MSNEGLYLQATIEVDSNDTQKDLWAKSMALTNGDEKLARYKYINFRVANLELSKKEVLLASKPDKKSLGKHLPSDSIFYGLLDSEIIEIINKSFNDIKNYPNGFSKSGDFSLKQSQIIEDCGNIFLALQDGINFEEISINDLDTKKLLDKANNNFKVWERYISRRKYTVYQPRVKLLSNEEKASQKIKCFGNYHDGEGDREMDSMPFQEEDREMDSGHRDDEDYY
jgi:uncharacterized protein YifE (UPF0438 family)